jgi:hypothetical protein
LGEHLQAAAAASGRVPDELVAPPLPPAVAALWEAFAALSAARGSNGFGPNPLTYADLAAWQQVHGVPLTGWEAEILLALDRVALATIHAQSES